VIEQGTMLDRIDFNIEQTQHHVEVGFENLKAADKMQKGYRNKLCMLLLCIGILLMVIVVLVKYFAFGKH